MLDESKLIARLKHPKHKNEAFRELLQLYKERLYWHIRKIVISHEDADDVLQETFIKIYKHINGFKAESKLFSWMYRIATNVALTQISKNAKQLKVSEELYKLKIINNLVSDVYFEGSIIQLKLQKAIATLPQKQQLVFNMKYFDNLTYKDISDILQTSEGALKASYHIAVKKLKSFLTQD